MHADVTDLNAFYASRLGVLAERSITAALSTLWVPLSNERLVGLGYALPFLDRFAADTERAFAFCPAQQGASCWPHGGPCATALVFEEDLPLPDASVDRVLMVHALEHAQDPRETMAETWRVLTPGGRLVVVVPNRRGVWARLEHTPFGAGRPWSRSQLSALLRAASFTPTAWADALLFAPSDTGLNERVAGVMERAGRRFWPLFAGAVVVEATKKVSQGIPAAQTRSRRVLVPVPAAQGL